MKKIFLLISLIFIYSCGYTPIYLEKKDILINLKEINGDFNLNNYIKNDIKIISNNDSENIIDLKAETKYEKIILTKDATGKATDYRLNFSVKFTILSEENKVLIYEENFQIKDNDETFEQSNYEKEIKRNFAKSITDRLVAKLLTSDDN